MRRVVGWVAGSWISRVYLAAVVGTTVWAEWSVRTWEGSDANLAGVVPMLLTMPASLLMLPLVEVSWAFWYCGIVIGALVNAAIFHGIWRLVGRLARTTAPTASTESTTSTAARK
ncbi:SCO4225 family membrane protein [Kineosporia mesophila]|uniref:SCO4225 family membrane protein n=1 Tax=Kineosporia mesophila TaxID=566012 RepID=UPI001E4924BA|nr:hypothetical protein [Kineosporia mesophila]MCD5349373.1 hypothetical protein [Kineosporia mesophila]